MSKTKARHCAAVSTKLTVRIIFLFQAESDAEELRHLLDQEQGRVAQVTEELRKMSDSSERDEQARQVSNSCTLCPLFVSVLWSPSAYYGAAQEDMSQ